MMRFSGALIGSIPAAVMIVWAGAVPAIAAGTAIAIETGPGRWVSLTTGTRGGACWAGPARAICHDGAAQAWAERDGGCLQASGGGRCELMAAGPPAWDEVEPGQVSTQDSSIDVRCSTGALAGDVYTLSDGDGKGSCGPDRGVGGVVIGATCTRNGSECASVSCDTGCGTVSQNCECRLKSSARRVVRPTE